MVWIIIKDRDMTGVRYTSVWIISYRLLAARGAASHSPHSSASVWRKHLLLVFLFLARAETNSRTNSPLHVLHPLVFHEHHRPHLSGEVTNALWYLNNVAIVEHPTSWVHQSVIMDWVISDELQLTVGHVVGWVSAGAMIVGGVIPYIPQYKQIKQTQDAEGFSLLVCLALLIANTLRILFWWVMY